MCVLVDDAVSGTTEVSLRSEEKDVIRSRSAASVGSLLHRCSSASALHHGDEDEEHTHDEGQTQESHIIRSQVRFFCMSELKRI